MSFNVVLYEPEIPQNTGNIGRLCVNSGSSLHIVGTPAFDLSEKAVRRAGLDYWKDLELHLHDDWENFREFAGSRGNIVLVTKFGKKLYSQNTFQGNEFLVFGRETSGLPENIRNQFDGENMVYIPMKQGSRSINLSNAVAIVLYEGIRQTSL